MPDFESVADRAAFVADFGEDATFVVGAVSTTVAAIFHNGTSRSDVFDGPGVLNRRATLSLPAASVPDGAAKGDAVTVAAVSYEIKSIEPDGTGWCLVRLEQGGS